MSDNDIVLGLTTIIVFGVGAQWVARRVGFPSLLLLLPAGVVAGATDLVDPAGIFGETLFPLVTLLVALLLFQSGLSLDLADLPRPDRTPVARLVTVGGLITFVGASLAVLALFDVATDMAFLIGAILVVSGPTVVGPLLSVLRAREPTGTILRWESTTLDPVGATLGVVMLNLVLASGREGLHPAVQMLGRLGLGVGVGVIAAVLLVVVMSRFLVSDDMEAAVAVLFAVAAFGAAEVVLSEAGLFATLTLGIVAGNQRIVPTARIAGFGETLEVLIIGVLFILLGALVSLDALWGVAPQVAILVALLVLVVRPLATAVSLVRTHLPWQDRAMIGWVDPRGIVAAATAAQFAGSLGSAGLPTDELLSIAFGVILGTGVIYGLTAKPMARALGVSRPPSNGVAIVGQQPWLLELGRQLQALGVPVLVLTAQVPETIAEDDDGLPVVSLLDSEERVRSAIAEADLHAAVVAARPGAVVTLVSADLIERLGRRHVLRLPHSSEHGIQGALDRDWNPHPFVAGTTWADVADRAERGETVQVLPLDQVPSLTDRRGDVDPAGPLPLAVVEPDGHVDLRPGRSAVRPGSTVLALAP